MQHTHTKMKLKQILFLLLQMNLIYCLNDDAKKCCIVEMPTFPDLIGHFRLRFPHLKASNEAEACQNNLSNMSNEHNLVETLFQLGRQMFSTGHWSQWLNKSILKVSCASQTLMDDKIPQIKLSSNNLSHRGLISKFDWFYLTQVNIIFCLLFRLVWNTTVDSNHCLLHSFHWTNAFV